jgi:ABC-type phosphate transport system substrate-binding protein
MLAIGARAADLVVIANPESPVAALSKEQVTDLFLGKATSLPGFCCPMLIDQPESSPLREVFYSSVTGKSAAQAKSGWAKLYFTGKALPPKEGGSSDEIRKMVAGNKNMLGYVEKSMADASVKVVFGAP